MRLPGHPEGGGDALAGDVVVGRADAAGGEHQVEAGAALVHGLDDGAGDVGDDADLADRQAEGAQALGEETDVGVLGAAREDLVADDQDAAREVRHGWSLQGEALPRKLAHRKFRSSGISGLPAGVIG